MNTHILSIGDLRLDIDRRVVVRNNNELEISGLSFELLHVLAKKWPETVSRRELIREVWGDTQVSDDALRQRVSLLRKSLGVPEYVKSVKGVGYRLAGMKSARPPSRRDWRFRSVWAFGVAIVLVVFADGSLISYLRHLVIHAIRH